MKHDRSCSKMAFRTVFENFCHNVLINTSNVSMCIRRNTALDQTFLLMYYTCNLNKNSQTYAYMIIVTIIWIQIQNVASNDLNLVIWNVCVEYLIGKVSFSTFDVCLLFLAKAKVGPTVLQHCMLVLLNSILHNTIHHLTQAYTISLTQPYVTPYIKDTKTDNWQSTELRCFAWLHTLYT